jgi:hypothetical protein
VQPGLEPLVLTVRASLSGSNSCHRWHPTPPPASNSARMAPAVEDERRSVLVFSPLSAHGRAAARAGSADAGGTDADSSELFVLTHGGGPSPAASAVDKDDVDKPPPASARFSQLARSHGTCDQYSGVAAELTCPTVRGHNQDERRGRRGRARRVTIDTSRTNTRGACRYTSALRD